MILSDLKVQPLTTENLVELLELDQICFDGMWTMEGYLRELESPTSCFLGLFLPDDSIVNSSLLGMGCFWSVLEEAHITILAVHPEYQGYGLGQFLLYSLLREAWEKGLERVTLEVRASNIAAICLYQKFGFKVAGRRPRYYQDNNEDALIFWLSQLQTSQFIGILEQWENMVNRKLIIDN